MFLQFHEGFPFPSLQRGGGKSFMGLQEPAEIFRTLALILQPTKEFPLHTRFELYFCSLQKDFRSPPLASFPASFSIEFLGKLIEKVANGDHLISGCLGTGCRCEPVAKRPKCQVMAGLVEREFTKSVLVAIVILNSC